MLILFNKHGYENTFTPIYFMQSTKSCELNTYIKAYILKTTNSLKNRRITKH